MTRLLKIVVIFLFLSIFPASIKAAVSLDVVINEIAWMGTKVSYNDEWIELYNNTDSKINLSGWLLTAKDGTPKINLNSEIEAKGFYLLERTNDETVPGILANQIYSGALGNNGEDLELYDNHGNLIDALNCISGWFAGDNTTKQTMERKNPQTSGNDSFNWQTSQSPGGTPKSENIKTSEISKQETEIISPTPILPQDEQIEQNEQNEQIEQTENNPPMIFPNGIVLNEILPSPEGPDAENEWIEIFNQNNFLVDISGWKIADKIGDVHTYIFPKGTEISKKGFFIISRPLTKIVLNNNGDTLILSQPNDNIVDSVSYDNALLGQSYNRTDSGWKWSSVLTPGRENFISKTSANNTEKRDLSSSFNASASEKNEEQSFLLDKTAAQISSSLRNKSSPNFSPTIVISLTVAVFSALIILMIKKTIAKNK